MGKVNRLCNITFFCPVLSSRQSTMYYIQPTPDPARRPGITPPQYTKHALIWSLWVQFWTKTYRPFAPVIFLSIVCYLSMLSTVTLPVKNVSEINQTIFFFKLCYTFMNFPITRCSLQKEWKEWFVLFAKKRAIRRKNQGQYSKGCSGIQ